MAMLNNQMVIQLRKRYQLKSLHQTWQWKITPVADDLPIKTYSIVNLWEDHLQLE
jgi:hypothetical protein